jgi:hypothetical protein
LLELVQTVTLMISRFMTITFTPTADTTGYLRRPSSTSEGLRLRKLSTWRVGRTLEKPIVPIPEVLEVVDLARVDEHGYSKRVNCCVAPLLSSH